MRHSVTPPMRAVAVAAAVGALGLALAGPAAADDAAGFYKGKTVKMVIGYPAGSGYDVNARLLVHHIEKYIPGHPDVIAQNMPGAGSLKAANWIYNVAPKDGTILGAINRSLAMAPLLETDPEKKALLKFDPLKFNWLGSLAKVTSLAVCRDDSGFTSFDQFRKRQVIETASSPTSDSTVFPTVFNNMLGTKIKIIGGHQGSTGNYLALERGEAQCYFGTTLSSLESIHPKWAEPDSPFLNIVVQIATEKNPRLPHVPLIMEYANEKQQQALELMLAPQVMGRPHFTTPAVPADRVAALRKAYAETMKDPAFLEEAKKTGIVVDAITGEQVEALLKRIYKSDPDVVKMLQDAMPTSG